MCRVQKQELLNHEEQEEYNGKTSTEEVLPSLQKAYFSQGDKGVTIDD